MNKRLNILMMRPEPSPLTIGLQHIMVVEPLELEIMAALIKPSDQVSIIDMILENKTPEYFIHQIMPDVLCLTGYITHIPRIIEYCRLAKETNPAIITIVGGVHFECFPEDIENEYIDFRVVRNAVNVFPLLLEHIRDPLNQVLPSGVLNKEMKKNDQELPEYEFFVPLPRRDLTQKYRKKYFYVFHDKVALLKTSFGCPYKCEFCFCRKITGDQYYVRPLAEIMQELKQINEKEIYIVDDDFLYSPKRINKFLELIEENNIQKRFLVYGRADFIAKNEDLIERFKKLGLRTIIVGLESFTDQELEDYNKSSAADLNDRAMHILRKHHVDCYAAIIIHPHWDKDDFRYLRKKMHELKIKFVNLQPLTPLPGTDMEVEDELILQREDHARWDLAHVSLRPKEMSIRDFYGEIMYSYKQVLFRPANIAAHMKYPPRMHLKMIKGLLRVRKQYNKIRKEAESYA